MNVLEAVESPPIWLRVHPYLDAGRSESDEPIAVVFRKAREVWAHYQEPVSRSQDSTITWKFQRLAGEWKEAIKYSSALDEIVLHPAYQQIIGMGPDVVPFILRELERAPGPWSWALRSITGVDPVPRESRGKLRETTRCWLEWARGQRIKW